MPIYEYLCAHCHHTSDILQKISDPPVEQCPECQAPGLKKLVSAPGFRLSGGGWYETDFKGEGDKKRNLTSADKEAPVSKEAPKETPATTSASASGGTEAKAATPKKEVGSSSGKTTAE